MSLTARTRMASPIFTFAMRNVLDGLPKAPVPLLLRARSTRALQRSARATAVILEHRHRVHDAPTKNDAGEHFEPTRVQHSMAKSQHRDTSR